MYVPRPNLVTDDEQIRDLVRSAGIGTLFSAADGPEATTLPIIWEGDRVIAHLARANAHWRQLDGAECLLVVVGPDAYISPSWYAAKQEHGRVVPTWNYSSVQLRGTAVVHDDPMWTRDMVERLTELHEAGFADPWAVSDAPAEYVDQQLRAIVGIEIRVQKVSAKAKWSQNRSAADQDGVAAGLAARDTAQTDRAAAEFDRFRSRS